MAHAARNVRIVLFVSMAFALGWFAPEWNDSAILERPPTTLQQDRQAEKDAIAEAHAYMVEQAAEMGCTEDPDLGWGIVAVHNVEGTDQGIVYMLDFQTAWDLGQQGIVEVVAGCK